MAPPAGVEPTTYRLGGDSVNSSDAVDSTDNSSSERPISDDELRSYLRVIPNPLKPLLDGILAGLAIVGVMVLVIAVALRAWHHAEPHAPAYAPVCHDARANPFCDRSGP